jgi:transposase InsO family protein
MDLRRQFVVAASTPGTNFSALCREHGISRNNGYKWLGRFKALGGEGLKDRSRRPKTRCDTGVETVLRIIELRHQYPDWGAKKIRVLLLREGSDAPSVKTIARVLDRAGEPRIRKSRRRLYVVSREHEPLFAKAPNDVWTVDFKGWWRTRDGKRFEPLTVRDSFSRFLLCLQMLGSLKAEVVRPVFQRLFERYGLPSIIRVDNGAPFACTSAPGGLSRLSAWWTSLGIRVSFSRPAHPQDNGAHERMHADVASELEAEPADTLEIQQRAADRWRTTFNQVRPHEALKMKTPAEVYARSPRRYRGITLPKYPLNHVRRRINRLGCVHYNGRTVFISSSLAGHDVAIRLRAGRLSVRFYGLRLGLFDLASAPLHHSPRLIPQVHFPKPKIAISR